MRPSARRLAALVLGVFALGVLAPFAHIALVPHVTCPVDGALVHGEHADHPAEAAHEAGEDGAVLTAGESGAAGHEHCVIALGLPPVTQSMTTPRAVPFARVALATLPLPDEADREESIPRFYLAPKQSPPKLG